MRSTLPGALRKIMEDQEEGSAVLSSPEGKVRRVCLWVRISARIMGHYFNNGYIQADILERSVQLSEDKKWFYITIAMKEG